MIDPRSGRVMRSALGRIGHGRLAQSVLDREAGLWRIRPTPPQSASHAVVGGSGQVNRAKLIWFVARAACRSMIMQVVSHLNGSRAQTCTWLAFDVAADDLGAKIALVDITSRRVTSRRSGYGVDILMGRVFVGVVVVRVVMGLGACGVMLVDGQSGRHLEATATFVR